jgi:hypothetical protein
LVTTNDVLSAEYKRTGDIRYLHRFFAANQGLINKEFSEIAGYPREWMAGQAWIHLVAAAESWVAGKSLLTGHWVRRMKWKLPNELIRETSLVVPPHRELRNAADRLVAMERHTVEFRPGDLDGEYEEEGVA